jgi:hypothetical protein
MKSFNSIFWVVIISCTSANFVISRELAHPYSPATITNPLGFNGHSYLIDTVDVKNAKDSVAKDCEIKDIRDIAASIFSKHKPKKAKKDKNLSLMLLPNISFNPQNGLLLGVAASAALYLGDRASTNISFTNASVAYTTKNQLVSFIKAAVYTKDNGFFLESDWKFYLFQAPTFGLGTNAPDTTFERHNGFLGIPLDESSGGFPMKYNYLILRQTVNKKIFEDFYVGIGYSLESYWNIDDENLKLDTIPIQITPHYAYSKRHNFDSSRYITSGLSANVMFDSRDNQISPYKGYYANINYRYNPKFLGSSEASSELWAEFRTYVGVSHKIPRHLVAFWVFGNFQTSGVMPYYSLFATADDQKSRSGRGYIAGRFRGESTVYAEAEYRFPILPCSQTLGGVIFVNATTTSNKAGKIGLFDYVRPSLGFGIRVLFNKNTRLNINIDYAFGFKSQGFYFAGGEAF